MAPSTKRFARSIARPGWSATASPPIPGGSSTSSTSICWRPRPPDALRLGDTLSILHQVFNLLTALSGLMTESMTRGPGWRFVDMGRRLERALNVLRLLRRTVVRGGEVSVSMLESVLEIADSTMTYRYRYMTSLQLAPLLDLLLTDETNPRSVGYQLAALADHVRQLPGKEANPLRNRETRIMIATQAELRLVDVESLAQPARKASAGRWTTSWRTSPCSCGSFRTASRKPISLTPARRGSWGRPPAGKEPGDEIRSHTPHDISLQRAGHAGAQLDAPHSADPRPAALFGEPTGHFAGAVACGTGPTTSATR